MARTKTFDTEEILDKAVELFWCKGYNGASMQDVVDCLGLSRSSLYDTFGDKRQLFLEALNKYKREEATRLMELVRESTDIKATLSTLFAYAVEQSLDDRLSKGCFMVNSAIELAPHDADVALLVRANQRDIEQAFRAAIQKGQVDGQISTRHTPESLARFLFNALSGLRVAAKSGASPEVFADIVQVTLSVL